MDGEIRRKEIINQLNEANGPLSGSALAKRFGVSRQVIVTDVTLLRALGQKIISTHKGYLLEDRDEIIRRLKVRHNDDEILDELYTIVDAGGKVLDVVISHGIYGEIKADLVLSSRKDVDEFSSQMKAGKIAPLKNLTGDYHYHTIAGDTDELLDFIEEKLKEKGYLIE
ncbi:MAG TPA: transcription repressor NadR [Anaerovoracaceae bacterium]|nr:transcription repressor NadR [Anaerovoracaceae bacterium]